MKHLLTLILLACANPSFAQTQKDYEHVIAQFMQFYNHNDADSFNNLFSIASKDELWTRKQIEELRIRYGKMRTYKFVELYKPADNHGGGDALALFYTTFNRAKQMTAISLDKQNKILTFRYHTSSPHIDSLLDKMK